MNNAKTILTNSIFNDRYRVDRAYLESLDTRALLQNYTLEAGVILEGNFVTPKPEETYLHWGWEAPMCQLRGHFLGHWMSACARVVMMEGKDATRALYAKLMEVVDKLDEYQELSDDGWVAPIPQKFMNILRKGDRYIWSPQYTMHKLVMGLTDTYEFTGCEKALKVLSGLADWYLNWTDENEKKYPEATYRGETGGMLEIWARLYIMTKDERYMKLARAYDHPEMAGMLERQEDPLTANHTNASIPWAHGFAAMYLATQDKRYLELTSKFWQCAVSDRENYATGGQNAGEFWIPKGKLGEYISDRNQEFCTMYNMVRLADYLYRFTGDSEYLDYIERCIYNGFLAQQNPHTGMPTYFLPMRSGSVKTWGSKTRDFWCCHGTMIQSQTLYSALAFYADETDRTVVLAQFIPGSTEIVTDGSKVKLSLQSDTRTSSSDVLFEEMGGDIPSRWAYTLKVSCEKETEFTLKIRIPGWNTGKAFVKVESADESLKGNTSEKIRITEESGFVILKGLWKEECISVRFNAELYTEGLPDRKDLAAVMEGPIVIASVGEAAVLPDEPGKCLIPKTERVYQTNPWMQSTYFLPDSGPDRDFKPLYEIVDEKYSIYQKKAY
ncbi:MAG: glycoside hydrolase family 127 protein [Lachnospiraceae bacterium]|nr:glycoside hydrolase family 127 protein [Lachnospiraceae bacterium]